jgi:hypothetical protein
MVGITLPGSVSADESGGSGQQAAQQAGQGQGQDAVRPGVVEAAPAEGGKGIGLDPLTDDEMQRVEKIALSRQLLRGSENAEGERGPETINVELAEPNEGELDDPGAPRRADVTFYDYKDDTLVTKTVNLDTGKVETTGTQHGVQPPFSRTETEEAARLLIADPAGAGLKADYKDATDNELTSPDQLVLSGMVFRADAGTRPATLAKCGEQRCVRLFTKVRNGPWIDTRALIINLSTRKVAQLG